MKTSKIDLLVLVILTLGVLAIGAGIIFNEWHKREVTLRIKQIERT